MVSDSITNVSIPSAPKSARDLGKKKRARSAKLKQCKLDVRREQWLSSGAVVKKECKEEQNGGVQGRRERNSPREMGPREGENVRSIHHDSDLDSNSPSSFTSSVLGGHDSETFTGSSSSSSSGDCCSGNITEEDEDDGCLDDWEAVADALAADEKPKNQNPEPQREHEAIAKSVPASQIENSKPQCARAMPKAWRPDDAFRPQSLPNLAKQLSLPNSSGKRFGGGGVAWGCNSVVSPPSSCPICYEDLDLTDTSFLPCLCGFRLCLFCHKRILEGDGRCPGCRKPYESEPVEAETSVHGGSLTFRLPRSCSMITRS
ncbi:uncharacterized protein LOC133746441 [Rosa rugosa]|uniref:uncharacterized protein LOC133746441 n=1 Tax=Rosa rugosa TaxID=74645 RepID=UPI002B417FE3|nr:uncharacterized protein LOC133746441 [Rosa rugosa]